MHELSLLRRCEPAGRKMSNRAKWFITTREESSKHVKENQLNMVQVNNRKHNMESKGWWEKVGKLPGCTKAIKHL